jgi:putative transposase
MSYNGAMRKQYSPTIKAQIVTEVLKEEKPLNQLSSEFGVSAKQLTRWKNHTLTELPRLFESNSEQVKEQYEHKINELYAEIGRLTTQVNWLKKKSGPGLFSSRKY